MPNVKTVKSEVFASDSPKQNRLMQPRFTFQKKLEEVFPVVIESVQSESDFTREALSDFNSVVSNVRE